MPKLEKGGSEHSFGIHVAEIAGMPRSIVKRANVNRHAGASVNAFISTAGAIALAFEETFHQITPGAKHANHQTKT